LKLKILPAKQGEIMGVLITAVVFINDVPNWTFHDKKFVIEPMTEEYGVMEARFSARSDVVACAKLADNSLAK
jgi:hypothetical protein